MGLIIQLPGGLELVPYLLGHRMTFSVPGWEPEGDTTTIILQPLPQVSEPTNLDTISRSARHRLFIRFMGIQLIERKS